MVCCLLQPDEIIYVVVVSNRPSYDDHVTCEDKLQRDYTNLQKNAALIYGRKDFT